MPTTDNVQKVKLDYDVVMLKKKLESSQACAVDKSLKSDQACRELIVTVGLEHKKFNKESKASMERILANFQGTYGKILMEILSGLLEHRVKKSRDKK